MAWIAVGVDEQVVAVRVARLTWRRYVRARQREFRRTVIKCGRLPHHRRVAVLTSMTESCDHVIGIRRYCEICRMTHVAIDVCQFVVAIDVTRLTRRRQVRSRQRELRSAMVES
jgi:hypothetical protein